MKLACGQGPPPYQSRLRTLTGRGANELAIYKARYPVDFIEFRITNRQRLHSNPMPKQGNQYHLPHSHWKCLDSCKVML